MPGNDEQKNTWQVAIILLLAQAVFSIFVVFRALPEEPAAAVKELNKRLRMIVLFFFVVCAAMFVYLRFFYGIAMVWS